MATMDLSKAGPAIAAGDVDEEEAVEVEEETVTAAVVPRTTTAVATTGGGPDMSELLEDLMVPTLAIKHKMTEPEPDSEADKAKVGNFILEKTYDLGRELEIIPVASQTCYSESLEFGSSDAPRVFNSKAEVAAAGGMIAKGKGENLFHKESKILVLVKKPEGVSDDCADQFVYDTEDGNSYGLAMIYAKGSSFVIHRRIFTDEKTVKWMLGDMKKGRFKLEIKEIIFSATGKPGPVPKIGRPKPSTDAERELAESCLNFNFGGEEEEEA